MADTPDIRPHLQRAISAKPQTWAANTYESCRDILAATLHMAGPDWQYVGKTGTMDGESVQPPGFAPFDVALIRPDGQPQTVRIVGVSHDAAWHVPSGRQVKVIVNSAANSDPRPEIHGPARIGGDVIPTEHYRWHNPPVAQIGGAQPIPVPPQPGPQPPQPPANFTITDEEFRAAAQNLERMYSADYPEGLGRQADRTYVDVLGRGRWPVDYYTARVQGFSHEAAMQVVRVRIRAAAQPPLPATEPMPTPGG